MVRVKICVVGLGLGVELEVVSTLMLQRLEAVYT